MKLSTPTIIDWTITTDISTKVVLSEFAELMISVSVMYRITAIDENQAAL